MLLGTSPLLLATAMAVAGVAAGGEIDGERTWTCDAGLEAWRLPQPEGDVVPDPGEPGNKVVRIHTERPHHTRVALAERERFTDFLLTLRVKVVDWEGDPPVVYLYGRGASGGAFLGLQFDATGTGLLGWYGKGKPSVRSDRAGIRLARDGEWTVLAFACVGERAAGKSWTWGGREPRWQNEVTAPNLPATQIGFGVWTHPQRPSKATVLFDDVRLVPLTSGLASGLRLFQSRQRPLDTAAVGRRRPGRFGDDERAGVVSDQVALALDRVTGEITNIVDLASGQEFGAATARSPLFSLTLSQPGRGLTTHSSSRDFASVTVDPLGTTGLRLTFGEHISVPVDVEADVLPHEDGGLRFRLRCRNSSEWAVAGVGFPLWAGRPELSGDGSDDVLLLPWSSGAVLPAPGLRHVRRDALYPGSVFAQFWAHYGTDAGLYTACLDAEGNCKRVRLACRPGHSISLGVEHLFPEEVGRAVSVPYDVEIRTFRGDWRDAAEIYKRWAVKQPWCAVKLADRTDVPAFLKEGAGVVVAGIQSPAGRAGLVGEQLEKLPDLMDAYREATGLKHMVFVPYGWENRGTWAGINYLPAVPSNEAWLAANRALRERGHRAAFMTSGFWWVVRRQKTSSGPAFDDSAELAARGGMCIRRADGSLWDVDSFEKTKAHGSWRGYSVALCHGSRKALNTMRDTFLETARLGVPLISFDQEIGGAQAAACYDPSHGHPPGYGAWMWRGFRDLCREILAEGKPVQPELGLFLENVSELAIPYMATYWSRQFGEVDVGCADARGIGLFSYLYHEYVTAIGAACVQGQGELGSQPPAELRAFVLSNNLVRGLIPGPFMHHVPLSGGSTWSRHVATAYCAYSRPYAHFAEYLILGCARRPPPLDCATFDTYLWRRDAVRGTPRRENGVPVVQIPVTLPTVNVGAFEAKDGSVAAFVVNSTAEAQDAAVHLSGVRAVSVLDSERALLRTVETPEGGGLVRLHLGPFAVRVLLW